MNLPQEPYSWISIVVACGGIGAFIDFIVGKSGQRKALSYLEIWWIQLSDVQITTFGREESRIAAQVLYSCFGGLFSIRRCLSLSLITVFSIFTWFIASVINPLHLDVLTPIKYIGIAFVINLTLLTISLSVTQWLTRFASRIVSGNVFANILLYVSVLAVQYLLLIVAVAFQELIVRTFVFWGTNFMGIRGLGVVDLLKSDANYIISNVDWHPLSLARHFGSAFPGFNGAIQYISLVFSYFMGFARLVIASIFLVSFLFKPLKNISLLLMLRIVESDKPIFTLVLGGSAAIIKTVQEIVSKL